MRRTRCISLGLLLVFLALTPAAEARRGPCIPGIKRPTCHVWTAKVMAVADGDTVNVRVRQRGRWSPRRDVRLTGVQTMELRSYSRVGRGRRGACHARAAAERLEDLLMGRRTKRRKIRLAARHRNSVTRGRRGRLRRAIAFRQNGHWQDTGAVLMREGHGLWDPNHREWAWNKRYSKLAQLAALAGRRIWNTSACRHGPRQSSPLTVRVKWDAGGSDGRHPNGEWIRIRNHDPVRAVGLRGWWVRDSALRRYRFPRGAVIPPRRSIRVRVGRGRNRPRAFHWGLSAPIFENAKRRHGIGDGAYLFDRHGDLRAWRMYPCRAGC
jgi:endonuclease YncB( thermonuclease family)